MLLDSATRTRHLTAVLVGGPGGRLVPGTVGVVMCG